jgi:hypothetical protein
MRKPLVLLLVLALSPTFSLTSARLQTRTAVTDRDSKPGTATDYSAEQDFSGFKLIGQRIRLPTERNLQTPCQVKRQAISDTHADIENSLKSLEGDTDEPDWATVVTLHHNAGRAWLYTGEVNEGIREFEIAHRLAVEHQDKYSELKQSALDELQALGVAEMRRGEVENCALNHNAEMCILPLSVAAQHKRPSGSAKAIDYFEKYLLENPGNLETRWLLNVAYMTLGQYPDKVPPEYLISLSSLESKDEIKRFVDVATRAGIKAHGNAGGSIVDDFDNDGLMDAVISNVDPCTNLIFYHNNGDGTFSDWSAQTKLAEQPGSLNLVQTDYNNDGWLDIFVMRGGWEFPMRNSLLKNNGNGTFTDVTIQSGLGSTDHRTHSVAWADFDNDGWLDVFMGHELTASQLFRNRGDGTFEDVSSPAQVDFSSLTKGVTAGDYDNDGYPDVYVSNCGDPNLLLHNKGDGKFEQVAESLHVDKPLESFPTWFWDYDNDGWLDIYVASYVPSIRDTVRGFLGLPPQGETMKLYHNTGKGTFEDVTKVAGLERSVPVMGSNFGDLDGDGFLDFYLGTGAPSYSALAPNLMFRNRGGKSFVDVTGPTGTGHLQKGHGIAFSDINNDGTQDVFLNSGGAVAGDTYNKSLFINPGHGNNWISIKLTGVKTNRSAIGARIKLKVTGGPDEYPLRFRDVTSGGSFGASSLTQNIGLGKATRIETLEVWWPTSKTRQVFNNVAVNQFIEMKEFDTKYAKRQVKSFKIKESTPPMSQVHPHAHH